MIKPKSNIDLAIVNDTYFMVQKRRIEDLMREEEALEAHIEVS